ncbi:MAG: hypothetical protein M1816_003791 [Peltula sp. TS41687]|nr:MAG: hypothetical protein M1816_003791 [Peltula sp. TS41687]
MLLSLKQPAHHRPTILHESPPSNRTASTSTSISSSTVRFLPALVGASRPLHATSPRRTSSPRSMATSHRGLPPPSAMTLPAPTQPPPPGPPSIPPSMAQSMGQLPAPPSEWRNAEESMRSWLQAKQEEDRRKQEEEKTRQEGLRLEQRRIEQSMLHESLQGGIPPYLIPMVFAGMGGGTLPNATLEWAQHYMTQVHHFQQQQPPALPPAQMSPGSRRGSRVIGSAQQSPYVPPPPSMGHTGPGAHASPALTTSSQQGTPYLPNYPMSNAPPPSGRSGPSHAHGHPLPPTAVPRPAPHGVLPRLTTGEIQAQPPPPPVMGLPRGTTNHPLQQTQSGPTGHLGGSSHNQDLVQSSPSIYFHHWQPPTGTSGSKDAKEPGTPSDYASSPKKRKAGGSHQAAPPPSSQPIHTSPTFSSQSSTPGRRTGHGRTRSDASSRLDPGGPPSRSRLSEGGYNILSNNSGTGGGQQPQQQQQQHHLHHHQQQQEPPSASISEVGEPVDGGSSQQSHSRGRSGSRQSQSSQPGGTGTAKRRGSEREREITPPAAASYSRSQPGQTKQDIRHG